MANFTWEDFVAQSSEKPYAPENRGGFGDIASAGYKGLIRAGQLGSGIYSSVTGDYEENAVDRFLAEREKDTLAKPDLDTYLNQDSTLQKFIMGAVESTPVSILGLGAGIAAASSPITAPAAVPIALLTQAATLGPGTYGESKKRALQEGYEDEAASKYAAKQAFWETATELPGTVLGFGAASNLFKLTTKELGKLGLNTTIKNMLNPATKEASKLMLKKAGVNIGQLVGLEMGGEALTGYQQALAENELRGYQAVDPIDQAVEGAGTAMVMSMAFGGVTQGLAAKNRVALKNSARSTDPVTKSNVAKYVSNNIDDVEIKAAWDTYANSIVNTEGRSFNLDDRFVELAEQLKSYENSIIITPELILKGGDELKSAIDIELKRKEPLTLKQTLEAEKAGIPYAPQVNIEQQPTVPTKVISESVSLGPTEFGTGLKQRETELVNILETKKISKQRREQLTNELVDIRSKLSMARTPDLMNETPAGVALGVKEYREGGFKTAEQPVVTEPPSTALTQETPFGVVGTGISTTLPVSTMERINQTITEKVQKEQDQRRIDLENKQSVASGEERQRLAIQEFEEEYAKQFEEPNTKVDNPVVVERTRLTREIQKKEQTIELLSNAASKDPDNISVAQKLLDTRKELLQLREDLKSFDLENRKDMVVAKRMAAEDAHEAANEAYKTNQTQETFDNLQAATEELRKAQLTERFYSKTAKETNNAQKKEDLNVTVDVPGVQKADERLQLQKGSEEVSNGETEGVTDEETNLEGQKEIVAEEVESVTTKQTETPKVTEAKQLVDQNNGWDKLYRLWTLTKKVNKESLTETELQGYKTIVDEIKNYGVKGDELYQIFRSPEFKLFEAKKEGKDTQKVKDRLIKEEAPKLGKSVQYGPSSGISLQTSDTGRQENKESSKPLSSKSKWSFKKVGGDNFVEATSTEGEKSLLFKEKDSTWTFDLDGEVYSGNKTLTEAKKKLSEVSGDLLPTVKKQKNPRPKKSQSDIDMKLVSDKVKETMSEEELRSELDRVDPGYTVPIHVVPFNKLPKSIRDQIIAEGGLGTTKAVWIRPNKELGLTAGIYLIKENISTLDNVEEILTHEAVGHFGIEALINAGGTSWDQLHTLLKSLEAKGNKDVLEAIQTVNKNYFGGKTPTSKAEVTRHLREVIAHLAEKKANNPLLTRIIHAIKAGWNKIFGNTRLGFKDQQLRTLLSKALKTATQEVATVQSSKELYSAMVRSLYNTRQGTSTLGFIKNPSDKEYSLFVQSVTRELKEQGFKDISNPVRWLVDSNGDLYVWNAMDLDHTLFAEKNNISFKRKNSGLANSSVTASDIYDLIDEDGPLGDFKREDIESEEEYLDKEFEKINKDTTGTDNVSSFRQSTSRKFKEGAEWLRSIARPSMDVLMDINEKIAFKLNKKESAISHYISEWGRGAKNFIEQWNSLDSIEQYKLYYALINENKEELLQGLLNKNGNEKLKLAYTKLKEVLDTIEKLAIDVGAISDSLPNYFPRKYNDIGAFWEALKKDKSEDVVQMIPYLNKEIEKARTKAAASNKAFSELDKYDIIARFMNRGKYSRVPLPGGIKERQIVTLAPKYIQFLDTPEDALMTHFIEMADLITTAQMLGNSKFRVSKIKALQKLSETIISKKENGEDYKKEQEQYNKLSSKVESLNKQIESGIAAMVAKEDLTPEERNTVIRLINTRLRQRGTRGFISTVKNFGVMLALGHFTTAITQLTDQMLNVYKNNPSAALKGMIESIGNFKETHQFDFQGPLQEMPSSWDRSSNWIAKALKGSGFQALDMWGKESFLKATRDKWGNTSKERFAKKWSGMFDATGTELQSKLDSLQKDLRDGKNTEDTRSLMFFALSEVQPISLSQTPELYQRAGNGRILYTMKTFALRQANFVINEVAREVKAGNYVRAVGKLVSILALLSLAGAGTDTLKAIIEGRRIEDLDTEVITNLLKIGLLNRYTVEQGVKKGQLFSTIATDMLPVGLFMRPLNDVLKLKDGDPSIVKHIPIFGKPIFAMTPKYDELEAKRLRKRITEDITGIVEDGDDITNKLRKDIQDFNRVARQYDLEPVILSKLIKEKRRRFQKEQRKRNA